MTEQKNIIILYNPYYQEDVIEQHLEILKESGVVAFGKVKSALKKQEHPNEQKLEAMLGIGKSSFLGDLIVNKRLKL